MFSSQRVVSDGNLQELLGSQLEGEEGFYVNARRREKNSLFKYSVSDPAVRIFHRSRRRRGDCLTLTSSEGRLVSSGVNCKKERRPLCHRLGESFSLKKMTRIVKKARKASLRRWKERSESERHISTCDDGGRSDRELEYRECLIMFVSCKM